MLSFKFPIVFCYMTSGICLSQSYDFYLAELGQGSFFLLAIGAVFAAIGGWLFGKNDSNMYRQGMDQASKDIQDFERLLAEQKEREE